MRDKRVAIDSRILGLNCMLRSVMQIATVCLLGLYLTHAVCAYDWGYALPAVDSTGFSYSIK